MFGSFLVFYKSSLFFSKGQISNLSHIYFHWFCLCSVEVTLPLKRSDAGSIGSL